jgi:hypothetical protein
MNKRKVVVFILLFSLLFLSMPMPRRYLWIENRSNESLLATTQYHDSSRTHYQFLVPKDNIFNLLVEIYPYTNDPRNTFETVMRLMWEKMENLIFYDEDGNVLFELDDMDETYFSPDNTLIILTQEIINRQREKHATSTN